MDRELVLSTLGHTWFIDLDGTLLRHNGYLSEGHDSLLPNVKEFIASIPPEDYIVIVTSRDPSYAELTESFLARYEIPFNQILYELPYGERIVINDRKPSGLDTAIAVNLNRDEGPHINVVLDPLR